MRVYQRVSKTRRILRVDTRRTRQKLIRQLEETFDITSDYARGKVDRVTDEGGKVRLLSMIERQFWACIAAYIAQIINTVAKGTDERQLDKDLDKLEAMINQATATGKAPKTTGAAEAKPASGGTGTTVNAS